MLKHGLLFIVLSIIGILFLTQFAMFLHQLSAAHLWLTNKLMIIFARTGMGKLMGQVLALMIIPLIVALIPAFIYWLLRRREMPYFATILWLVWVMLITVIAI